MKQTEQLEFEFLKTLDLTSRIKKTQKNDALAQLKICRRCCERMEEGHECQINFSDEV